MNSHAETHFEMQLRRRGLPYETEGEQVAKIAAALRPRGAKESRIRRMTVRLGDFVAGLRCQLESRFATEPGATAC